MQQAGTTSGQPDRRKLANIEIFQGGGVEVNYRGRKERTVAGSPSRLAAEPVFGTVPKLAKQRRRGKT